MGYSKYCVLLRVADIFPKRCQSPFSKITVKIKSVDVTRQIHEREYSDWQHKTILQLNHLFQVSWAFTLFYKHIFESTFSFLFNIAFKTCPSSVILYNKIMYLKEIWQSCDIGSETVILIKEFQRKWFCHPV